MILLGDCCHTHTGTDATCQVTVSVAGLDWHIRMGSKPKQVDGTELAQAAQRYGRSLEPLLHSKSNVRLHRTR